MAQQPSDLITWGESYGNDVIILNDADNEVWEQYRSDMYKPQYIVIDRDLTVIFKGVGPDAVDAAESTVLELIAQ